MREGSIAAPLAHCGLGGVTGTCAGWVRAPGATLPGAKARCEAAGSTSPNGSGILRTVMRHFRLLRTLYLIGLVLIAQFLVTTLVAMVVYPGGTLFDPDAESYRFLENTFSELGRVYDFRGDPKPVSQWIFTTAMVLSGVGLAAAHGAFPGLFREAPRSARTLSAVTAGLGAVVAVGFIGIGIFPTDVQTRVHYVSVYFAFTGLLPAVAAAAAALMLHPAVPQSARAVHLAFAAVLLGYLWLLWFGPNRETPAGAFIQIAGQKIIVYAGVLAMTVQCAVAVNRLTRRLRSDREAAGTPGGNPERT